MLADIRDDVQIAGLGTETAAVTFFGNTHPRTGIDAGRDPDLDLLGLWRHAFAVAERARLAAAARAFAIGTRLRKLQPAAGPHYLASTCTSDT